MATLRPQRAQLVNGLISSLAVQVGHLVGLGCAALLGFELLPQFLHLLLRQCGLCLLLLGPRLLVAQLVPLGENTENGKNRTLRLWHVRRSRAVLGLSVAVSGWSTAQPGVRRSGERASE